MSYWTISSFLQQLGPSCHGPTAPNRRKLKDRSSYRTSPLSGNFVAEIPDVMSRAIAGVCRNSGNSSICIGSKPVQDTANYWSRYENEASRKSFNLKSKTNRGNASKIYPSRNGAASGGPENRSQWNYNSAISPTKIGCGEPKK